MRNTKENMHRKRKNKSLAEPQLIKKMFLAESFGTADKVKMGGRVGKVKMSTLAGQNTV